MTTSNFDPRAPCGARPDDVEKQACLTRISIHAPLAGRDKEEKTKKAGYKISIHAPLTGRDKCDHDGNRTTNRFQPTRPLRGATGGVVQLVARHTLFQPTRPLRGATRCSRPAASDSFISTHAPLTGRDGELCEQPARIFISTHAPLTGRDLDRRCRMARHGNFNPRAPYGARRPERLLSDGRNGFQPTRPLRGATVERCLIARFCYYFNPRAPYGARHSSPGESPVI